MNDYLEEVKVKAALRSEYIKMAYRKKNKPNDINILDYTIIESLEKQRSYNIIAGICKCGRLIDNIDVELYCKYCGQKLIKKN